MARLTSLARHRSELDWLRLVERSLAVLTLLTLGAGALTLALSWRRVPAMGTAEGQRWSFAPEPAVPLGFYAAAIEKRPLFPSSGEFTAAAPRPAVRAAAAAPPTAAPKPTLAQLAADLKLVGILNDGTQAVMTAKKGSETLYLSAGEQIGEIQVIAIHPDRVSLAYQGETMELSL